MIELLLVVAIIGLMASLAMFGQRHEQKKRRDVKRVANATELQKALALYSNTQGAYPNMTGCITGSDAVTTALRSGGFISEAIVDPLFPTDITKCYYYEGTNSTYTLRYTLEVSSTVGEAGEYTLVP